MTADIAATVSTGLAMLAGEPLPGDNTGPRLRQYVDDLGRVRPVYWVTALQTVVVVDS
ncbi:hypothetical protein [Streptomyces sp. NPDC058108]|uniref:hypothetical protein n=1 Tax=Streptomyces sp. NPDC058108 TaxID=3346344 RepID=UPI0036E0009D